MWLLGASDAAAETAALAEHVGFRVTVVDYDPAYINEERFPTSERILLPGPGFVGIDDIECAPEDYVCVLTRGHMFDPQGCVWGTRQHAHYVGMMGCKGKNDTRRACHRHRRRARGRALPAALLCRGPRQARRQPG